MAMLCPNQRHVKVFPGFLARQCKGILLVLLIIILWISFANYFKRDEPNIRARPSAPPLDYFACRLRVATSQPSKKDIVACVQKAFPKMPITFWEENQRRNLYYQNSSCARFPDVYNLQINNLYWQMLCTTNGTFYLYEAYYDKRQRNPTGTKVRVLSMVDRLPTVTTYCQMWFANSTEPVLVRTAEYQLVYDKAPKKIGPLYPYQILCPVPPHIKDQVPIFVSVVERACDIASNCLRVVYRPRPSNESADRENKPRIAVCVKRLDFPYADVSIRLIEWIELMGLLGVEKIYFYVLEVHENVTKVLQYYEKRDDRPAIEVTPISLAGGQPNIPGFRHLYNSRERRQKIRNEIVSHNDCLYKSIYQYDYVLVVDTDEVVLPVKEDNLPDMVERVARNLTSVSLVQKRGPPSHYLVGMRFFGPDIVNTTTDAAVAAAAAAEQTKDVPSYMYMLQHIWRNTKYDRYDFSYPKTFYNTDIVGAVKVHYPKFCLGPCNSQRIEQGDARMHHYRGQNYPFAAERNGEKSPLVADTTILKYKRLLINHTVTVMKELNFFETD